MKKIIATALCLTILAPSCLAKGKKHPAPPKRPPHYSYVVYDNHCDHHYRHHRASERTRTLAAVTGIAGVAALISAIID